jgi:hypothetical protein
MRAAMEDLLVAWEDPGRACVWLVKLAELEKFGHALLVEVWRAMYPEFCVACLSRGLLCRRADSGAASSR